MDFFIARQPIFIKNQKVFAYELLYRNSFNNSFSQEIGADEATAQVIINGFNNLGLKNLTNKRPAFVNFTRNLLEKEVATLFPPENIVIEILETVTPDKMVIEKCRKLKKMGYKIALDDFLFHKDYEPLIALADIIKIDFLETTAAYQKDIINKYRPTGIQFLAEKIETLEQFKYAVELGYLYFQGYFFSKPAILTSQTIQPVKQNYLRLIHTLNQEDFNFDNIAKIITADVSLSYNLLRMINSPYFGLKNKITNIKQALITLGENEIRKWATLISLQKMDEDKSDEILRMSMIRARWAELIAEILGIEEYAEELFLTGLFSMLDVIMDQPLKKILKNLNLSPRITEGLLNPDTLYHKVLQLIMAYEKGNWNKFKALSNILHIDSKKISDAYVSALFWYNEVNLLD